MSTVTCRHCGLPFRVRRVEPGRDYFCCTGCSLLARVPTDAQGNFPVNAPLVSALTVAFLYFNQLLAWAVSVLVAREGKLPLSNRLGWAAAGAALIVWVAVAVLQAKSGASRAKDMLVAVITLSLLVASIRTLPPSGSLCAAANAVFIAWSFRGALRRRASADFRPR